MENKKLNCNFGVITSYDGSYGTISFMGKEWTFIKRDIKDEEALHQNDLVTFREDKYNIDGQVEYVARFVKKLDLNTK